MILLVAAVIVLLFAVEAIFSPGNGEPELDTMPPESIKQKIVAACTKYALIYNLDYATLMAFIELESGFNPKALGDNGASFGLFQIQKSVYATMIAEGYSTFDWQFTIEGNVKLAAIYMNWLRNKFDVKDGATMREYWVLGPTKYRNGARAPEERAKFLAAYERYA